MFTLGKKRVCKKGTMFHEHKININRSNFYPIQSMQILHEESEQGRSRDPCL